MADLNELTKQFEVDLKQLNKTFEKIKANEGKDKYEMYCEEHPFHLNMVATVIDDPKQTDYRLVRVQLPKANITWTFDAFEWAKNFVLWSNEAAPVHGEYAPDADALYIRIPRKGIRLILG